MQSFLKFRTGLLWTLLWLLGSALSAGAGVSQSIQEEYKKNYEAKAMFLRIPVYTEEQFVFIEGQNFRISPGLGSPLHKVGEQLRIQQMRFGRDEIKLQVRAISSLGEAEIIFKFDAELQESFPNRDVFDRALEASFTEGLKSSDIENAKKTYLEREFDRSVGQMAGAASLSRDFVLETVAPLIPNYRQMQIERDALKEKVENVSSQLEQLQAEKRKLESQLNGQKTELSGLNSTNASLQKKIEDSESQVLQMDKELQEAKKRAQKFEREIASIQNSLNVESDANRDLTKNNEALGDRIRGLQEDLETQKSENERLSGEIEDNQTQIRNLNGTIRSLTSNKDSLGRQYVELKDEKESLDDFAQTVDALQARIVEEKTSGGRYNGKAEIFLEDVRLGSLEWSIPTYLGHNKSGDGKATFFAESIDYVKVTPEIRHILRTLGEEKLNVGINLAALTQTMKLTSEEETETRELGERESGTWNWRIMNSGTQDVPFVLTAHLINSHSRKISMFRTELTIVTANPIQRIRSYIQPVPLAAGVVLGFLLFGIVGIFRRPKARKSIPRPSPKKPAEPNTHATEKKL